MQRSITLLSRKGFLHFRGEAALRSWVSHIRSPESVVSLYMMMLLYRGCLSSIWRCVSCKLGLRHSNHAWTVVWLAQKRIPGGVPIWSSVLECSPEADGQAHQRPLGAFEPSLALVNRFRKWFRCSATFPSSTVRPRRVNSIPTQLDQLKFSHTIAISESKSSWITDSAG